MESQINEVEINMNGTKETVEFQDNITNTISNFHNYGKPSKNIELPSDKNNANSYTSIIFKVGESYICPECKQTFLYLSNLKRHTKNKHPYLLSTLFPSIKSKFIKNKKLPCSKNNVHLHKSNISKNRESYMCPECKKDFLYLKNLKRHVNSKHTSLLPTMFPSDKITPSIELLPSVKCSMCDKSFQNIKSMQAHGINAHNFYSRQHKCPLCPEMLGRNKFNEHFEETHDLFLKHLKINFGSYEEFCEWKKAIEKVTKSYFSKYGTKKTNNALHHIFICHRSGTFKYEASQKKRKLKTQGSRKINAYCPAAMRVIAMENGKCEVKFQTQHVGHENELQHLSLTFDERQYVAEKLATDLPLSDILKDIHESASKIGAERLCILTKKDLHNIKANFMKQKHLYLSTTKPDEKLINNLRDIHNKHAESEHISANITKIDKGWLLTLANCNEIYLITEKLKSCDCTLICIYCRACIQSYVCNCTDSYVEGNMCKHIHFFCMERNKVNDALDNNDSLDYNNDAPGNTDSLDYNNDVTEIPCSKQSNYLQESNNVLEPSELVKTDKNNIFVNSEKRNILKSQFSDIIDSITTEEEYTLSKSTIEDLTAKLKSIQIHTKNKDEAVTSVTSHPSENMLVNESMQDQHNSNSSETTRKSLILEMNNQRVGAKICYIRFSKMNTK